jgi:integrase
MGGHSKTDIRYWQSRVFSPVYRRPGENERIPVAHLAARVQFRGRRETFALATRNREAAAAKAREIYCFLIGNDWDATLAKYKPGTLREQGEIKTVGDFIREIRVTTTSRSRTVEDYCRCFRQIVSESFNIKGGVKRYDYRSGGRDKWLQRVDAVDLVKVTPELVQKWKISFLKRAGSSPAQQRSARVRVNTILRSARSLFSPRRLKFVPLHLPFGTPFTGVEFEARQSMRYQSTFDFEKLVEQALKGLGPEELKVFLLSSMAGLRRGEIDKLQWSAFQWQRKVLQIGATQHFQAKTESSIGEVDLDEELLTVFRGFRARAGSDTDFVLKSPVQSKRGATFAHYRGQRTFEKLSAWLRKKGVPGRTPIHTLRKEYGSRIAAQHGIYAASRSLRHAGIAITAQHYLDKKARATVGLGHLLQPANVIPIQSATHPDPSTTEPPKAESPDPIV